MPVKYFSVGKLLPASFGTGFVTGALIGIEIKTGIDASEEGISWLILNTMCSIKVLESKVLGFFCDWLWFWAIVFFLFGLATMAEDAKSNPLAYGAGLVLGFLFFLLA